MCGPTGSPPKTNSLCTHVVGHGVREQFECSCGVSEFEELSADRETLEEWSRKPLLLDPNREQDYFDGFLRSMCRVSPNDVHHRV